MAPEIKERSERFRSSANSISYIQPRERIPTTNTANNQYKGHTQTDMGNGFPHPHNPDSRSNEQLNNQHMQWQQDQLFDTRIQSPSGVSSENQRNKNPYEQVNPPQNQSPYRNQKQNTGGNQLMGNNRNQAPAGHQYQTNLSPNSPNFRYNNTLEDTRSIERKPETTTQNSIYLNPGYQTPIYSNSKQSNAIKQSQFFSEFASRSKSPNKSTLQSRFNKEEDFMNEPDGSDSLKQTKSVIKFTNQDERVPSNLLTKTTNMMSECQTVIKTKEELGLKKYPLKSPISEDGPFIVSDGGTYFGQVSDGKIEGRGKWVGTTGETYEGYWSGGLYEGEGRYINIKGDIYQGEWSKGRRKGKGLLQMPSGYLYRGNWLDDLPHGKGYERDAKGNTYDGEFERGLKTGRALIVNVGLNFTYDGEVKDGGFEGFGKLFCNDRKTKERRRG